MNGPKVICRRYDNDDPIFKDSLKLYTQVVIFVNNVYSPAHAHWYHLHVNNSSGLVLLQSGGGDVAGKHQFKPKHSYDHGISFRLQKLFFFYSSGMANNTKWITLNVKYTLQGRQLISRSSTVQVS